MAGKSITRNTALMTLASIAQKVISFVYFTIVARNIGPESTGKYFFALSFTTIFVVLVDFGFTNVFIRESARDKDQTAKYLQNVLGIKILLGIFTYIVVAVALYVLGYPIETRYLVYLSAVTMLFDSAHMTIYGALRAFGSLRYEALGMIFSQLTTMILGTIFIYLGFPLIFLILAYTIPAALNFVYATYNLSKNYGIKLRVGFDKKLLKLFFLMAWPFALGSIFARVYSYADSIMLSKLAGNVAVGLYSIPYKITYAFQFIPLALTAVLYPRFSEVFAENKNKLGEMAAASIKYLLFVVVPIVIGISVLGREIIISLYTTSYLASVFPLRILLVGLVFSFMSFPLTSLLNASNRQGTQTAIMSFVMVVNLVMNVIMIPRYGIIGAAISALVGNFLLMLLDFIFVSRVTVLPYYLLLKDFFTVLACGAVMGGVVYIVSLNFHYIVAVIAGVATYALCALVTRLITYADIRFFTSEIIGKHEKV